MGPYSTIQDHTGQYATIWDHKGSYGTICDYIQGTIRNHTGQDRILRNHKAPYGTTPAMGPQRTKEDTTRSYWTIKDHSGPYGTVWDHAEPCRVEKGGEHREHAPRTPKVFPRNTQGKKLSKRCLDSASSHMFHENSSIYQYFRSSSYSIEL